MRSELNGMLWRQLAAIIRRQMVVWKFGDEFS
jgi:hypothetical protein